MGQSSQSDGQLGRQITQSAVETFQAVFSQPDRSVRYAIPWIGIVFLMALPLPFLGVLDASQRPSPSGLDFSVTASFLALALHAGLWTRTVALDDHQSGVPLPFGFRELGIAIAGVVLVAPPLWLWSQAFGLWHSIDHQFFAIHRMAAWFGRDALFEFGFRPALETASIITGVLAVIASYACLRFAPVFAMVSTGKVAEPKDAWQATRGMSLIYLIGPMLLTALPLAAFAALTNQLSLCCTENPAAIGALEVIGTIILFPMSALVASALGLWCRAHRIV
ncbi:MAG: hypothetical protein KI792_04475 [Alphaproteobacteria bacterium]|nr:hypothetical protein [Alphaproteobacteria bacterium SS10]